MEFVLSIPALICFLVGLALVLIEVLTPGLGAPGVAGVLLLILAVVLQAQNLLQGLIMAAIVLVIIIVGLIIFLKRAGSGKIKKGAMILSDENEAQGHDNSAILGMEGVAQTDLRPSGQVRIEDRVYDVVARGGFVQKGADVAVVAADGMRIVVEERKDA